MTLAGDRMYCRDAPASFPNRPRPRDWEKMQLMLPLTYLKGQKQPALARKDTQKELVYFLTAFGGRAFFRRTHINGELISRTVTLVSFVVAPF